MLLIWPKIETYVQTDWLWSTGRGIVNYNIGLRKAKSMCKMQIWLNLQKNIAFDVWNCIAYLKFHVDSTFE